MNIIRKIQRKRPEILRLLFSDREPIVIDFRVTSTREVVASVKTLPWVEIEAYVGDSLYWHEKRDEVTLEDEDEEDLDLDPPKFPLPQIPPASQEPFVSPERWLSLMITAQKAASRGAERTIELLLSTMDAQNARQQDLLTQAHNMIVTQQEENERLLAIISEEKPEIPEDNNQLERIIEGLAPIVAPLLARAAQAQTAPAVAPAAPIPAQVAAPRKKKV